MTRPPSTLLLLVALGVDLGSATARVQAAEVRRFGIESPSVALRGVPVDHVAVLALDGDGKRVDDFAARVEIDGIRLTHHGEPVTEHAFEAGKLELATDASSRTTLELTGNVVVAPGTGAESRHDVTLLPGWLSLLPPLLAIVLAIWLRQVLAALFLGILGGALVLSVGNPVVALEAALSEFVLEQITSHLHVQVILFTTFLGSTVAVMAASGGTHALVGLLRPLLGTRRRTQLGTMGLGLLVFFDDYANTLLVGTTMRPVCDRQRISREKLAFLVDATAAPVAGLALVSTWVGFELGLIEAAYQQVGFDSQVFGTFVATIPYRFYPILVLLFVASVAGSGRDFGPMHRAERRARSRAAATTGSEGSHVVGREPPPDAPAVNAILPLAFLIVAIAAGLWWTGVVGLASSNADLAAKGEPPDPFTLTNVLSNADSYAVLLYSSFLASALAVGCAVATRTISLEESMHAWVDGTRQMLPAVMVLVLAWGLAAVCDDEHLNTAGYLVASTTGWVSAAWMPTIAFLLAAGVSFATGTAWGSMGLLVPLFVPFTYDLLAGGGGAVDPNDPLLLGTIGAVLAGSIFGDHCSPISDTTVLSSAAAGCDHLEHVATQLPYALTVAGVCLATCSIPVAFGVSPFVGLAVGGVAIVVIVRSVGRPVSSDPDGSADEAATSSPLV